MDRASEITIQLDSSRRGSAWNFESQSLGELLQYNQSGSLTELFRASTPRRQWSNPLDALRWMEADALRASSGDSRWIGYISYDFGRAFEELPESADEDVKVPLFRFTRHVRQPHGLPDSAEHAEPRHTSGLKSTFTKHDYIAAVARAIEYIKAGDVFQVNLSQRFSVPQTASPAAIYHRLRNLAPAQHGALLDYGDFAMIGNSPELFFRVTPLPDGSRMIITRPIKGTRPRQPGMENELLHSIKDQAELNMIIDLERNDLGRICEVGSVKVIEPRAIESHPTVYHGVATIEGRLRPEVGFVEILRAMFPGGSITGAPKIRAMEIIEELEPVRRGPYCGAIGYLAADGSMEFNIAIRTMIVKDNLVHIPVGGGIVADSDPDDEYEETLVKAQAMFNALGVSVGDLERR